MAVREIKGWTGVTHLPRQPEYVRGVLNLRGVMVPIVDLRCRFGQGDDRGDPHAHRDHRRDRSPAGRPPGRSRARHRLVHTGKIQAVPQVARGSRADMLSGLVTVENGMIALIDLAHLVPKETVAAMAQAA